MSLTIIILLGVAPRYCGNDALFYFLWCIEITDRYSGVGPDAILNAFPSLVSKTRTSISTISITRWPRNFRISHSLSWIYFGVSWELWQRSSLVYILFCHKYNHSLWLQQVNSKENLNDKYLSKATSKSLVITFYIIFISRKPLFFII